MKYNFLKYIFLLLMLVGAFFLGTAYANTAFFVSSFDLSSYALVEEVREVIDNDYLGEKDNEEMYYGMAKGMVRGLNDPYSEFFDPDEAKLFWDDLDGEFEGIGVEIVLEDGMAKVLTVLTDSPASKSGMMSDDIILAVDDADVMGKALGEIATLIQGPAGTDVKITVLRAEDLMDIMIKRDKLHADSVYVEEDESVLWAKITRFDDNTDVEFQNKLNQYELNNYEGIVLDVRNNPGGYFDSCVNLADMFLASGLIVVETNGDDLNQEFVARQGDKFEDVDVVVLINGSSASASEIVAGALKDNGRAQVVGVESYGKGSVQVVEELSDGSILKLTIAEWLTPDGLNLRLGGIVPDIVMENADGEDLQYDKAKELLINKE